uniref:Uncharacterized protein n=1 Tax=Eutreptiella gymnastica TaxID=73025 RepID=A0A7S1NAK9_9EUGL
MHCANTVRIRDFFEQNKENMCKKGEKVLKGQNQTKPRLENLKTWGHHVMRPCQLLLTQRPPWQARWWESWLADNVAHMQHDHQHMPDMKEKECVVSPCLTRPAVFQPCCRLVAKNS